MDGRSPEEIYYPKGLLRNNFRLIAMPVRKKDAKI